MRNTVFDENIFNHVEKYCKSKGWGTSGEDIVETIRESSIIWQDEPEHHRWWDEYFFVTEIDGMLIGYCDARTTGDNSASDCGYEFDPDLICEVVAKEVKITTYVKKV